MTLIHLGLGPGGGVRYMLTFGLALPPDLRFGLTRTAGSGGRRSLHAGADSRRRLRTSGAGAVWRMRRVLPGA